MDIAGGGGGGGVQRTPPPVLVVDVTSPVNTTLGCTVTELIQTTKSVDSVRKIAAFGTRKRMLFLGMTTKWTNMPPKRSS